LVQGLLISQKEVWCKPMRRRAEHVGQGDKCRFLLGQYCAERW
jgi:hypothetical protein